MKAKPYISYIRSLIVLALCSLVISCDSGSTDDGLVSVRYAITGSEGASVFVEYFNDQGWWVGQGRVIRAYTDWSYEFRVEESSQILMLSTNNVRDGEIQAEIFIDGKLHSSHTNTDSLRFERSSLAWLPEGGQILYWVQGARISPRPRILLPSGDTRDLSIPEPRPGFTDFGRGSLEANPRVGAPISISYSRPPIGSGRNCVELDLGYYFSELNRILALDSVQQCSFGEIDLKVEAVIPE